MHHHDNEVEDKETMIGGLRGWVMIWLTLIFVTLYAAALFGWLRPLSDVTMITRLEPIIFVIAGYYFGRLPGQSIERALKEEIVRWSKRTDAIQHAKELAEKERDAIEERAKNARIALSAYEVDLSKGGAMEKLGIDTRPAYIPVPKESVRIAVKILDS